MSDRWTPAPGRSHLFLSNDYYFPLKPHPRYLQSIHFTIWLSCLELRAARTNPRRRLHLVPDRVHYAHRSMSSRVGPFSIPM